MSKKNTIESNIETKPEIFANTFNHSELLRRPTQSFSKENMIRRHSNETINNTSNLMMTLSNKAQPINLEDVVIQEDKLWNILDNIRTNCNFNFTAEEYLEFSQISSVQDFSIFFSDKKIKNASTVSCIYEYITAMLCCFVYLKNLLSEQSVDHLKNMLYYSHQNLLLIINQILKKVNVEYKKIYGY